MSKLAIRFLLLVGLLALLGGSPPSALAAGATTELQIIKYAADGTTVLVEMTVSYEWMEEHLPVHGAGATHYYHQGPVFEGEMWDPSETQNLKDKGAVMGANARDLCDLVHLEGAEVLASYGQDFYSGLPALTVNQAGQGRAYYVATRTDGDFLYAFYEGLTADLGIPRMLDVILPEGVTVQARTDGERTFLFLLNFSAEWQMIDIGSEVYLDVLTGEEVRGRVPLDEYGSRVLEVIRQNEPARP